MIEKIVIKEWCKRNGNKATFYGEAPSIVILGETHGTQEHRNKQEDMITLVRPEYLLHECFDARTYDHKSKQVRFLNIPDRFSPVPVDRHTYEERNDLSEVEHATKWSEKYDFVLVGMDLSHVELERVGEEILSNSPRYALTSQSAKENVYREKRMGERMTEYIVKSSRPIVAIMGAHHMRPKSEIHPILQGNGLSYVCIDLRKKV